MFYRIILSQQNVSYSILSKVYKPVILGATLTKNALHLISWMEKILFSKASYMNENAKFTLISRSLHDYNC